MEPIVLINDGSKYAGKYVAIRGFGEKDVVASGNTPDDVYQITDKAGINNPIVFYVPEKDTIQII
ncbi:MAG: hypothetical protein HQK89_12570 [Nitrospirae bacterium]|nr:hypothetical protein [Nitrospirota bacterium]